jgi:hypothetical protein
MSATVESSAEEMRDRADDLPPIPDIGPPRTERPMLRREELVEVVE